MTTTIDDLVRSVEEAVDIKTASALDLIRTLDKLGIDHPPQRIRVLEAIQRKRQGDQKNDESR